ncbi:MAG: hypothetical protein ACLQOZ_13670 [Acidimicrobiales bacterium]
MTTASVLKAAKTAIAEQTGVHVVFDANSSSSSTHEKLIADVGATTGTENVSEGKSVLAVRVNPAFAYVSGNQSGLAALFGLSAKDAKKLGADWESWKSGTAQYANLKADVTFAAVTALLPTPKGTKLSTDISNGTRFYVLKWTTAGTSSEPELSNTLTLSTGGAILPTEETTTAPGGAKLTTVLSDWGEQVVVATPPVASTVASAQVAG